MALFITRDEWIEHCGVTDPELERERWQERRDGTTAPCLECGCADRALCARYGHDIPWSCPNCGSEAGEAVETERWPFGPDSDDWQGCTVCAHDLWASQRGLPTQAELARIAREPKAEDKPEPDWVTPRTPPVGATQVVERWDGTRWVEIRQRWDGERFRNMEPDPPARPPAKAYEEYGRWQQMELGA